MTRNQTYRTRPEGLGGLEELTLLENEKLAAHQTRHTHPGSQPDDGDHDPDGLIPPQGQNRDNEHESRQRDHHVDKPHQDALEPTTNVTGDRAKKRADSHRDANGEKTEAQHRQPVLSELTPDNVPLPDSLALFTFPPHVSSTREP